jgi:hypothetical protein
VTDSAELIPRRTGRDALEKKVDIRLETVVTLQRLEGAFSAPFFWSIVDYDFSSSGDSSTSCHDIESGGCSTDG